MTVILDGKKISEKILSELSAKIARLSKKPSLAVILVGNNPASELYVGMKEETAKNIGIKSTVFRYSQDTSEAEILNKINELNQDENTNAILVQLPLPKQINSLNVIQAISPKKDVDGLTPENVGRISIGAKPYVYPCTPKGILRLLDEYDIQLEGKHAVVVGRSNIVGKPLALMLLNKNATVTVCHSRTKNLESIIKTADILISAVGINKIIRKNMVSENTVVVDVGVSKIDGKTCGDVDVDVANIASCISRPIGGVGPMTIASLMLNTYELSQLSAD